MQTILVIDDDESLRDTIGVMLEQEGFRAVLAGDGRSGFDKAVTIKPDMVLVDLRLPGMSGIEICKQLRSSKQNLPIIVIRAVLRRASPDARKVIHFSDTEVDFERRIVSRKGEELRLTPAEYNLLCYF